MVSFTLVSKKYEVNGDVHTQNSRAVFCLHNAVLRLIKLSLVDGSMDQLEIADHFGLVTQTQL